MIDASGTELLKGVSRSFYLSLRLLPRPMRKTASLAYLLARTSDTLADNAGACLETRMRCLDWFGRALAGGEPELHWPPDLVAAADDPRERRLLEATSGLLHGLAGLPPAEADLAREVTGVIISGQKLDLQRFGGAEGGGARALSDDGELEDYTWRVAGCVGEFWTRLGFLTMGGRFSRCPEAELVEMGVDYGKGLQLVNILRDVAEDLADGRCYLPVVEPGDRECLMAGHRRWLDRAEVLVDRGFAYESRLRSRRLRVATVLPAWIARETLERMKGASWEELEARVKIPRRRVYLAMARAFWNAS